MDELQKENEMLKDYILALENWKDYAENKLKELADVIEEILKK